MRRQYSALLTLASTAWASQAVFSVHDDVLAFPQYEVVFKDSFISDVDAHSLIQGLSYEAFEDARHENIDLMGLQAHLSENDRTHASSSQETYEVIIQDGERFFCSIPTVEAQTKNETSEAEARAAEEKELARATDRGVELLQDLDGPCMYFLSDYWSYSFCYTSEVKQFHALPRQPGKLPVEDKSITPFILGRARTGTDKIEESDTTSVDVRKSKKPISTTTTELHVKGDTKYMSQQLEDGTICDLTGNPRRVEVQYHCSPNTRDRIGYIKEVTTCTYLLVIYTEKLCKDIAFMPPKENTANEISCRMIVPENELEQWEEVRKWANQLEDQIQEEEEKLVIVGGTVLGGKQVVGRGEKILPVPGKDSMTPNKIAELIAKGAAEGGLVEVLSDEAIKKLDLDPKDIEKLREQLQEMAGDKSWKLELIEVQGDLREIRGIVDDDEEQESTASSKDSEVKEAEDTEEGSEEEYKEEL